MGVFKKSYLFLVIVGFLGLACQPKPETAEKQSKLVIDKLSIVEYKECKEPRPEVCTKEYSAVCAKRDTGIRCVKMPCPSTKDVTKPNACVACSDKNVFGYSVGACSVAN